MFPSCQATNLAGTGQQATPVAVRHTGRQFAFMLQNILLNAVMAWNSFICSAVIDSNCVCFSDALPRGSSLSDRQLLPQRRLLCLLQVYRGARLQVDLSAGEGREPLSKQILWPLISTWIAIWVS